MVAVSERRRLTVNTIANGIAQFAGMASGFVLMPFIVREFGLAPYGLYMIAQSIVGYTSLLDLGVGASLIKLIAEHVARKEYEESSRLASGGLAFYAAVGIIVAVMVALMALNVEALFPVVAGNAALLRNLLLVASIGSLLGWPLGTGSVLLQSHQRYTTTARTALLSVLANIAVTVLVLASHRGLVVLMALTSLVGVAAGTLNTVLGLRAVRPMRVNPFRTGGRSTFQRIFKLSWALFVMQVCSVIIYQQTDRLILGVWAGAAAVTLYEAASKFQSLVVQLTGFSNSAVLPFASSLHADQRESALQTLFLRGTKYSLALVLPFVVTLMIFARPLLLRWLGPEFAAQALAAQVFLSHQLLTPSTAVGDAATTGMGAIKKRVPYVVWILAAGNLAIALALVGRLGILAVVLGTAVPHLIDYPLHMRFLLRELRVPIGDYFRRVALRVYPALAAPLLVGFLMLRTALVDSLLGVAAAMAACVCSYWLLWLATGLDRVERDEVKAVIRRLAAHISRA